MGKRHTVSVEVYLDEFDDEDIRREYEERFGKKLGGVPPWKNDKGELTLSFTGLDAGRVRDAIENADHRHLYDLVKAAYVLAGKP